MARVRTKAPAKKRRAKRKAAARRTGARLVYRDPRGDGWLRWAPWVRALKGKSGAYVIRSKRTKRIWYVGESHSGRLYDTITRHFRAWSGIHAGTTYDRAAVEVAVIQAPKNRAYALQVRLIQTLRPRDNVVHKYKLSKGGGEDADDFYDP